jgi:4-hydroxy-2-oxoheptanedioate aldolase
LDEAKTIFGTWCEIPTSYAVNIVASAGMDFVILDMEHGVMEYETIQNMVFAAHCESCSVMVRVPCVSEEYVLRALDTGADGIIVPQVASMTDIQNIIQYSKYAPKGNKGFNPYVKSGGFSSVDIDFFPTQNKKSILGIILEKKETLTIIEDILQNEEIDIIYIGQYDLSVSLGVPGQVNHPMVLDLLDRAVHTICKYGKYAGCMVHSVDEAKQAVEKGMKYIVYKVDAGVLFQEYHSFTMEVRKF